MSVGEHERQDEDHWQDPEEPTEVVHERQHDDERPCVAALHEPRRKFAAHEARRRHQRAVEEHQPDHVAMVTADDQGTHDAEHRERHDVGNLRRDGLAVRDDDGRADHSEAEEDGQADPWPPSRRCTDALSR